MKRKVLILGGTGMLGHTLFREFSQQEDMDVYATARTGNSLECWFPPALLKKVKVGVDADNFDTVIGAFASVQPDLVINCIGLIKQQSIANDPLSAITINSQLPHRISLVCRTAGARLIHISTDCVFDGKKGQYLETDPSNAIDLYGRSKFLGEVAYPPHCITLRTSIIGHELKGKLGLVEWFLNQEGWVRGFTRAIYSGFPTLEFARIIADYVIPNDQLTGIYHVSSNPISKYDLLKLVAERYKKQIEIDAYEDFVIERSLDSTLFRRLTGYQPPSWSELIDLMYQHYLSSYDQKLQSKGK